jgi:hypothetical protein
MVLSKHRIARVLLAVVLCVSLIAIVGCSPGEDKPEATPASGPEEDGDQHNVAPGNTAQDAVDELNEKIDDSTSEDP